MPIPIFERFSDDILIGSTVSGATPLTSYSASTLTTHNPAARVLYGSTTVTITFTLGASATGSILVIPMHNLTNLTLTNGAGLSQAITPQALFVDGFPPTLAYDFSALANRNSNIWNLVISGNATNVKMGGAVMIYGTKRDVTSLNHTKNFIYDYDETETQNYEEVKNEYQTPYVEEYGTVDRGIGINAFGRVSDIQMLKDWFRANAGGARPGFLWLDPTDASGGKFGRWQKTYQTKALSGTRRLLNMKFDEWPKGQAF